MLAICNNCSNLFESSVFRFANAEIAMENVTTVERCPLCGHVGQKKILDGKFTLDKNGISTLLSGPQFTKDILLRFKLLVEEAKDNNYSNEQFAEKASIIHPLLKRILEMLSHKYAGAVFGLVAALYPILKDIIDKDKTQQTITINNTTINQFVTNSKPSIKMPSEAKFSRGTNLTAPKKKRKR